VVDQGTWVAIRHAFEAGGASVASLAATFGVNASTVYSRIRREKWKRPARPNERAKCESRKGARAGRRKQRGPRTATVEETSSRHAVVQPAEAGMGTGLEEGQKPSRQLWERLYNAIDGKLSRLERRMRSGVPVSAADSERETRELSSMVRSYEKVLEVAAEIEGRDQATSGGRDSEKAGSRAAAKEAAADAERLREEILARLARLHGEREPEDHPGGASP